MTTLERIEAAEHLVTIAALLATGIWTIRKGLWQRERAHRMEIDHSVSAHSLGEGKRLVTVVLTIRNTGKGLVIASNGYVRLRQVFPRALDSDQTTTISEGRTPLEEHRPWIAFKSIDGERAIGPWDNPHSIEPGESDCIPCDFVIGEHVRTVRAESFVPNPEHPESGWHKVTMHDFAAPQGGA